MLNQLSFAAVLFVWLAAVSAAAAGRPADVPEDGGMASVAGTGAPGYAGDGGPAAAALLNQPFHCCFDRQGNLFVADMGNHCVRKVDRRTGTITTVAGNGQKGYSGDGGPATRATMNEPYGVLADRDGNLFIVDRLNACIRRVDAVSGIITTLAGTGARGYSGDGGPALEATFYGPKWVHVGDDGHVYVVDTENHCVRRIDLKTGIVTTVAGGRRGPGGDGGPAADAGMDRPHGCWVRNGILYTADTNNHRIRANRLR